MKIDDIGSKQRLDISREPTRQAPAESKKSFESLLEQEIGVSDSESESIARNSGVQAPFVTPGMLTDSLQPNSPKSTSRALDWVKMLETGLNGIQESLDMASGDARKLESTIRSLPNHAESFKAQLGELSDGHPLRSIADELEIMAYVESIKWNRGDYL